MQDAGEQSGHRKSIQGKKKRMLGRKKFTFLTDANKRDSLVS